MDTTNQEPIGKVIDYIDINNPTKKPVFSFWIVILSFLAISTLVVVGYFVKIKNYIGPASSNTSPIKTNPVVIQKNRDLVSSHVFDYLNANQLRENVSIKIGSKTITEQTEMVRSTNSLSTNAVIDGRNYQVKLTNNKHIFIDKSLSKVTTFNLVDSNVINDNLYTFRYLNLLKDAQQRGYVSHKVLPNGNTLFSISNLKSLTFFPKIFNFDAIASETNNLVTLEISQLGNLLKADEYFDTKNVSVVFNDVSNDTGQITELPLDNGNEIILKDIKDGQTVFGLFPVAVSPMDDLNSSYSTNTMELLFKQPELYDQYWSQYSSNELESESPPVYIKINDILISGQNVIGFNETKGIGGLSKKLFFNLPKSLKPGYYNILVHYIDSDYLLEKSLLVTSPLNITPESRLSINSTDEMSFSRDKNNLPVPSKFSVTGTGFVPGMEIKIGELNATYETNSPENITVQVPENLSSGYYDLTIISFQEGVSQQASKPSVILMTSQIIESTSPSTN
jgi:hypothetical protein